MCAILKANAIGQAAQLGGLLLLLGTGAAVGQPKPGTVIWTYEAGAKLQSSPALASDGTIYVGGAALYAITNNGSVASNKWTAPVAGGPAIGSDGTIYTVYAGTLTALNPNGSVRWTFTGGTSSGGLAAIASDNTLYFFGGRELHAISASGTQKWAYDLAPPGVPVQSPVIGADGTIYVGVEDTLYALSPYGTNKWSFTLHSPGFDSLSIGAGGVIYASAGSLWAFAPNGNRLWSTGSFNGSATTGRNGAVYAADSDRALHTVTPDGQLSWLTLTNAPRYGNYTAPAVDAGGTVYYCVSNNLWALNPQGQVQWSVAAPYVPDPQADVANTSPIIGPDGTIYAALGTKLYAIASGTNGPANSPWPMYRQNVRHTGKVEKPALTLPQKRSDANFELELFGQLGDAFTIESSSNLVSWTPLTNFVATNVPMDVVDPTSSNAPYRFYRATSP